MLTAPVTAVGVPGTVRGVIELDAVEFGLSPAVLVALTVKVYALPLARPVTVQLVPGVLQPWPPGVAVTV